MPPNSGAMMVAMIKATKAERRPTLTVCCSPALGLMSCLYMSMVKMVAVELSMDANEETMAAASAAMAIPLSPVGKNCINHG